ncbi:uncharacterized protein LOC142893015 isoform X2 [Nelusetta ayraudi]|uniref:uncharacterized protein LOC142893015 isoform X2 n=1 Tax=Nelusetta ayraudi TaxID=303726 RepID=UPI003F6EAF9A
MKPSSLTVICLALFLLPLHFSEGAKSKYKKPSSSGSSSSSSSNTRSSSSSNSGSSSNRANSNKPSSTNHGYGHPQPGWHGNKGNNQNPSWNSPNTRGHGTHGGYGGHQGGYGGNQGGYGGHQGGYGGNQGGYGNNQGGYGGHQGGYGAGYGTGYGGYGGGYQGGYINRNPANKISSPHYSESVGYGGYGVGRGSPFSRSVQNANIFPSDKSRGFGRTAVVAAAGGAAGGMAMGYGLGRIHHPQVPLNSPQEEYYYNNYVYRKQGTKAAKTEGNRVNSGYSDSKVNEDDTYSIHEPPMNYNGFMEKCMSQLANDQAKIIEQSNKITTATTTTARTTRAVTTSALSDSAGSNGTAVNESTSPLSKPEAKSMTPNLSKTPDNDKIVSIVEIGYPELIYQHNLKTCMERFFASSEFIKGGAQGMVTASQGFVALTTSVTVILLNSHMLMSLYRGPFSC